MFYYVWGWGEIIHCNKWLCQFCCKLSSCCSVINSTRNICENHHTAFWGGKQLKKSVLVNKPFLKALRISGSEHNFWVILLTNSASLLPVNKARLHVREGWDRWYRNRGVSPRKTQPKLHFLCSPGYGLGVHCSSNLSYWYHHLPASPRHSLSSAQPHVADTTDVFSQVRCSWGQQLHSL